MASIFLTFMDAKNGTITASYSLDDKDVQRMYDAYRYRHGELLLQDKVGAGEILEADDTINNLGSKFTCQDIVNSAGAQIVGTMINSVHEVETRIEFQKIADQVQRIEIKGK